MSTTEPEPAEEPQQPTEEPQPDQVEQEPAPPEPVPPNYGTPTDYPGQAGERGPAWQPEEEGTEEEAGE